MKTAAHSEAEIALDEGFDRPEAEAGRSEWEAEPGAPVNGILAYLSHVGEAPLLTREQEKQLAIAMEDGTASTFSCLVCIPFCREHLLTFPHRLTSGEVALQDVATLEDEPQEHADDDNRSTD